MNKKLNTVLFLLAASIYNIVIMLLIIVASLFIVAKIIPKDVAPGLVSGVFILIFILGIGGSFYIYHKTVRYIAGKVDMNKYFLPLFKSRK